MAPNFRHGKDGYLAIVIGGTTTVLSTGFDDASLKRMVDTAEVTVYQDGDKKFLAGHKDKTLSISGNFSSTHEGLLAGRLGQSTGQSLVFGPEDNTTGRRKYLIPGIITSLDVAGPAKDKVAMSFEWQGSGAMTSTTF